MISVIFILIQIASAYLLYLPFSRKITFEQKKSLKKAFPFWILANFALNCLIFSHGLDYFTYKLGVFTYWFSYFFMSMAIIRNKIPQHFFVLGMQGLWCFMCHSSASVLIKIYIGDMTEELLTLQILIYFGLLVILLPLERKFFINLLPTDKFFENRSLGWCISLLPIAIFIGTFIPVIEVTFLPTWREKLSRLMIPITFLLIYRSLGLTTQQVEKRSLQEQKNQILERQVTSLTENNALLAKNQREVTELRKKLSENYSELENLINAGKIPEAMNFISNQVEILDSTRIKQFSKLPLINAAISIYFRRAEELGIKISHKIDLTEELSTDESDLAVLVSNLLENAIKASTKQKNPSEREISIILRNIKGQNVLEIGNRYDFPIKLGENGLPYTTEIGHGLGMSSLEIFAKKYAAFVNFSQENGFVQVSLYWNDNFVDPEEKSRGGGGVQSFKAIKLIAKKLFTGEITHKFNFNVLFFALTDWN